MSVFSPVYFSLADYAGERWASFPFYRGSLPFEKDIYGVSVPRCGLSLRSAGSMKYRCGEDNPRRASFFSSIGIPPDSAAPVQLMHSKKVYTVSSASEMKGREGDGVLTCSPAVVPSVTAADCMPVYLFDPVTECFGVVHSGWKGTGIAAEAIAAAGRRWGAKPENFLAVLGPHIRQCCYTVDDERARYFRSAFSPDCVCAANCCEASCCSEGARAVHIPRAAGKPAAGFPWRLSLEKANLALLEKAGVRDIAVCTDCTSCSPFLGSFRRETAEENASCGTEFTCMAAFVFSPYICRSFILE